MVTIGLFRQDARRRQLRLRPLLAATLAGEFPVPAYLLATYMATSRLHENQHFLSDVVFGSAFVTAAARVTLRRDKESRVVTSTDPHLWRCRSAGVVVNP